jgi:hypothetical protein
MWSFVVHSVVVIVYQEWLNQGDWNGLEMWTGGANTGNSLLLDVSAGGIIL